MQRTRQWTLAAVAVLAAASIAGADTIFVANAGGEIVPRNELDLNSAIIVPGQENFPPGSQTLISYGGPVGVGEFGISALAAGVDEQGGPLLLIGTGIGKTHLRSVNNVDMSDNYPTGANFTNLTGTNEPTTALASRPDGDVVIGISYAGGIDGDPEHYLHGDVYVQGPLNLNAQAPGHSGGPAFGPSNSGQGISAIEILSNGNVVIGTQGADLGILTGTSVSTPALGVLNNGSFIGATTSQITDLALTSTDTILIGKDDGTVETRGTADLAVSLGSVDFSSASEFNQPVGVTALAMLSNDRVVIGFDNGSVIVRDSAALGTDLGATQFVTLTQNGRDITALTVTSLGNIVIGTEGAPGDGTNGELYVQTAADLTMAAGVGGGAIFNYDITGLAAFDFNLGPPGGCGLLLGDGTNDCLVTADDLISVQQNFGNVGPAGDGTDFGDTSDDGMVTADDLIEVQQNFGCTPTTSGCFFNGSMVLGPAGGGVPEPASLTLIGLGAAALLRRRR